jgi:hypothetical protein
MGKAGNSSCHRAPSRGPDLSGLRGAATAAPKRSALLSRRLDIETLIAKLDRARLEEDVDQVQILMDSGLFSSRQYGLEMAHTVAVIGDFMETDQRREWLVEALPALDPLPQDWDRFWADFYGQCFQLFGARVNDIWAPAGELLNKAGKTLVCDRRLDHGWFGLFAGVTNDLWLKQNQVAATEQEIGPAISVLSFAKGFVGPGWRRDALEGALVASNTGFEGLDDQVGAAWIAALTAQKMAR